MQVYPNPASSSVNLLIAAHDNVENALIRILDLGGKEVLSYNAGAMLAGQNTVTLPIENINNGVYYVIANVNGTPVTQKLVIVK